MVKHIIDSKIIIRNQIDSFPFAKNKLFQPLQVKSASLWQQN